jgi:thiol-disulfide isomerase/thioredoxin
MRKYLFLLVAILGTSITTKAQIAVASRRIKLDQNTVVKDSTGMKLPYSTWQTLIMSGDFSLKPEDPKSDTTAYILYRMTDEQKSKRLSRMGKPAESKFFTTGEKITSFNANDIAGLKLKLKELEGKTVVINFWFIGCPPCRQEIPELNKLALSYASDPNIVFIAIALDEKYDIKQFVKANPFAYHIISDGQMYAKLYNINLYPTNVVLDKEGKVKFHASGYTLNTPEWIRKTIEEVK